MSHAKRWLPALIIPVVVAAAITVPILAANATPNLPKKSAAQILALTAKSDNIAGLTGTLEQKSNLGLPNLSGLNLGTGSASSSAGTTTSSTTSTEALNEVISILSSNQKARISSSSAGERFQLYQDSDEQDLIVNRGNIWLWDSSTQSVTHIKLPTLSAAVAKKVKALIELSTPVAPAYTPYRLSKQLIASLDEHTATKVGKNQYVAGKAAYTLVFTPRESGTLVKSIQLAVDAKTGLPLKFGVYAKGEANPAYELAYTSLDYAKPTAETFKFTAPKGAKVTTVDYSLPKLKALLQQYAKHVQAAKIADSSAKTDLSPGLLDPTTLSSKSDIETQLKKLQGNAPSILSMLDFSGTGWASTVTLPAGTVGDLSSNKQLSALTTKLANGDQAISTSLVSVLIRKDGSVSFGAVPVKSLAATK